MQRTVVIVKAGEWGCVKQEIYDGVAEALRLILENSKRESLCKPYEEEKIFASVWTVETVEEAEKTAFDGIDIIIFLSRVHAKRARAIKEKYPQVQVVIYSGLIPEEEIIWIKKGWPLEVTTGIINNL